MLLIHTRWIPQHLWRCVLCVCLCNVGKQHRETAGTEKRASADTFPHNAGPLYWLTQQTFQIFLQSLLKNARLALCSNFIMGLLKRWHTAQNSSWAFVGNSCDCTFPVWISCIFSLDWDGSFGLATARVSELVRSRRAACHAHIWCRQSVPGLSFWGLHSDIHCCLAHREGEGGGVPQGSQLTNFCVSVLAFPTASRDLLKVGGQAEVVTRAGTMPFPVPSGVSIIVAAPAKTESQISVPGHFVVAFRKLQLALARRHLSPRLKGSRRKSWAARLWRQQDTVTQGRSGLWPQQRALCLPCWYGIWDASILKGCEVAGGTTSG